jgi:hypothetical protein
LNYKIVKSSIKYAVIKGQILLMKTFTLSCTNEDLPCEWQVERLYKDITEALEKAEAGYCPECGSKIRVINEGE